MDKDTCDKCGEMHGEHFMIWIDNFDKLICHRCANALIDALRANQKKETEDIP